MQHSEFLQDFLIFLAAAVVVVPLFRKLRSSPVLGYLVAGLIIGPHGLAIIEASEAVHKLAEFGVVFLLFMIGLELSVSRLQKLGGRVFGLGLIQVIVTGFIIGALAWLLGSDVEAAVIIGGGLALSSTAFVLQLLTEQGKRATVFGLTAFSILLVQDLAVVPMLIFVSLQANPEASLLNTIGLAVVKGASAVAIVILFGRFLLRPLFHLISAMRNPELFVAATLLTVLGGGWVMSLAGLSMALGALLAGLLLSETEYRHQVEADIRPFRGILLGLFFMTIGMSIDVHLIGENFLLVMGVVAGLLIGKSVITALLSRLAGFHAQTSVRIGLALSQGGEFGFVLFGVAVSAGLLPVHDAQILMAAIAISMALTPFMFIVGDYLAALFRESRPPQPETPLESGIGTAEDIVLIAGFGRVGQAVAKVLSQAGVSYIALDLDRSRVGRCRAMGLPVYYGDAERLQVLQAAGAERAKSAVITIDQRQAASRIVRSLHAEYPDLPIYVRARDRRHLGDLKEAGAATVVPEAAEASLQLGSVVLAALNVGADDIATVIGVLRENDYALLDDVIGE